MSVLAVLRGKLMDLQHPLKNQTVLVTGATGGIGRSIVQRIAELGGQPLIHFRSNADEAKRLLREIGGNGRILQANLMENDGAVELWAAAEATGLKIGGLVNNAGIRATARVDDTFEAWSEAWDEDLRVNLRAPADLCKCAIQYFRKNQGGRIVNIASRAAQRGYTEDHMPYGVAKAGLVNLTKSIARSFGKDGIIAVAIAPGFVRT
jgi:NAD(P)-dependent dehydrogenase (short-subunit alcohol dehydrogenase family)